MTEAKTFSFYLQSLFAIYSAVLLVSGVIKIRKFFRERDAVDSINTKLLTRHAVAFVCLLFGILFFATSLLIWQLFNYDDAFLIIVFIGEIAF